MPKGRGVPRREVKKAKKKETKRVVLEPLTEFVSADVEVVARRRKPREEEE